MDTHTVTAFTPFRLLDLPPEIRNVIYEAAIFDLSPPDMFSKLEDPDSRRLRKMNANILLTNRKMYWEARNVIVRQGRLILVSLSISTTGGLYEMLVRALCKITAIDPVYRKLCIMSHHIVSPGYGGFTKEFIIHRQEAQFFCRVMMGEFDYYLAEDFGLRTTHILNLNCSPTYAQLESRSVYYAQTLVLEDYQNILRGFVNLTIRGASDGWESGLYGAVLQAVRSIDYQEPTELIDDLCNLEQQGSRILLQTGDVEAADVIWDKALRKCIIEEAGFSNSLSALSNPRWFEVSRFPKGVRHQHFPIHIRSAIMRWVQLRRQNCNEFPVAFLEIWYKLISHRLSGALRFIEQGHHLEIRHGRAPRPKDDYLRFVSACYRDLCHFWQYGKTRPPLPSDEAEFCRTAAAIYRLLDASIEASIAYKAVCRAVELVPDDEPIQQEKERVETWIRRLMDNGMLEHFPSPESSTESSHAWFKWARGVYGNWNEVG